MTDAAFLDPQIGCYRRANGKRPWREGRLGAVLEMIRNGDLWKPGDRLLVGLTAQAMARAGDLEAEWAGSVAPAEEGERDNPAHAEYYRRKDFYGDLKNGKDSNTLSNTLSAATFGGIFDGCRDSGMRSHSGLIGADLDHLNRQGRSAGEIGSGGAGPGDADAVRSLRLYLPVPGRSEGPLPSGPGADEPGGADGGVGAGGATADEGPRNSDGNPDSPQVVVFLATIVDVTVGS